MSRKHRLPVPEGADLAVEMEERIARLREMLVLMAPETGSCALGATMKGYLRDTTDDHRALLPSPEAAGF